MSTCKQQTSLSFNVKNVLAACFSYFSILFSFNRPLRIKWLTFCSFVHLCVCAYDSNRIRFIYFFLVKATIKTGKTLSCNTDHNNKWMNEWLSDLSMWNDECVVVIVDFVLLLYVWLWFSKLICINGMGLLEISSRHAIHLRLHVSHSTYCNTKAQRTRTNVLHKMSISVCPFEINLYRCRTAEPKQKGKSWGE